jgi:hypothetical protein
MANLYGLDAVGNAAYVKSTGTGTDVDPYLVQNDLFSPALKSAILTSSGNADIIAGVGGAKLRVLAMAITAASGCTVKLQRAGTTDITPPFHIGTDGNMTVSSPLGLFESGVGEKINAVMSGVTTYSVLLSYREVV